MSKTNKKKIPHSKSLPACRCEEIKLGTVDAFEAATDAFNTLNAYKEKWENMLTGMNLVREGTTMPDLYLMMVTIVIEEVYNMTTSLACAQKALMKVSDGAKKYEKRPPVQLFGFANEE